MLFLNASRVPNVFWGFHDKLDIFDQLFYARKKCQHFIEMDIYFFTLAPLYYRFTSTFKAIIQVLSFPGSW